MSDPIQIAWAAGLFEGEGCISSTPKVGTRARNRVLALVMTDRDIVERFHRVVGGVGTFRSRRLTNDKWKDQWEWRCTGWGEIVHVLTLLGPHLGERRSAAAAAMLASPPLGRGVREHCKRAGHPFFGPEANYRISPRGAKVCLTCQNDPDVRRRKKERARELRALKTSA